MMAVNGYLIENPERNKLPLQPKAEWGWWHSELLRDRTRPGRLRRKPARICKSSSGSSIHPNGTSIVSRWLAPSLSEHGRAWRHPWRQVLRWRSRSFRRKGYGYGSLPGPEDHAAWLVDRHWAPRSRLDRLPASTDEDPANRKPAKHLLGDAGLNQVLRNFSL